MKKQTITFLFVFLLIGFSVNAHADGAGIDSRDLLDNILYRFSNNASMWSHTILSYARYLFWSLAMISMVWTYGMMALRRADIQEFLAETVRFLVVVGFFYWLLDNGPAIATSIMDSMRRLAANASGIDARVSPSDIVDVGFDIVSKAIDNSSVWSPAATTVGLIVAGIILIVLAMVSINMLIILITGWILTYGGIILLGFGGGRWTQDIAIQYYKTILGIALQAFAMILIIGIGKSFVDQYYAAMSKDILLKEMFVMLVVAVVLLVLINKIPPILASIVSGGSGGGGGGGLGLGGALGAAGIAGSALAGSMGAASAHSAGGLSALNAAFKAASQSIGTGDIGAMSGNSSGPKSGGLARAMGQASKFAGSFGSHLASGAFDVAREKAGSMKASFSAKTSDTTGGKIAEAINQRVSSKSDSATSNQPSDSQNVTSMGAPEGSFSSGSEPSFPEEGSTDEVSQFVNQKASGDNQ
ncbi:TPA: P-type conjugative transfer protein TrbL [Legionella pneumophila]|uniref:P-type conjugative transfer protein TrbL n=1 Tax=Legionella pneumophila TaxID=446 RepID=UPI00077CA61D|nr:P-type conjugative transfer protein TrbL [Legionella pneumophila]AMQ26643.1 conjugal transfer protein [Legionella pneumophila subsp. pneumophila]PQM73304.1 P-type conjugative transfer protein TrbL [Legionella pneumophila]HAT3844123.1 P-type conjugative transfer protein TrbL [Legionella pneumophila]HAU0263369.1 P-type conjugative transfer protein TrbL [Legionella pneumophila]HAU0297901.1 P-type conjugative transfer protein TrbL [Legionella pneumophila]